MKNMTTKIALQIILWSPTEWSMIEVATLRYYHEIFWPKKPMPICIKADRNFRIDDSIKRRLLHDKIHDMALTHLANLIDSICK